MKWSRLSSIAALAMTLAALLLAPAAPAAIQHRYKVLHNFTGGLDGGLLATTPVLDAASNLYGTTYWGGTSTWCTYGCGVIFKMASRGASSAWKGSVLLDFDKSTGGAESYAPLLFDGAGGLFGSTVNIGGGSYVFELTPGAPEWNFEPIYEPAGYCLVFDQSGNLYGIFFPGTIGELSPGSSGWTFTDLYDFPPDSVSGIVAPLTWDAKGNLYGAALFGGNYPPKCPGSGGCGEAFQLANNGDGTWAYHVLHRFAAFKNDGYYPYAGLTVDASGNAYGLTQSGGKYGTGTFYKLTPSKSGPWKETILYEFPNCANGCGPSFTLVADKAGNFYSSGAGGNHCGYDCGTVFKFSPQKNGTWKYSVVHKFNGTDGEYPYGVVLDDKGNIFGTTMNGGKYNLGVAFEITP